MGYVAGSRRLIGWRMGPAGGCRWASLAHRVYRAGASGRSPRPRPGGLGQRLASRTRATGAHYPSMQLRSRRLWRKLARAAPPIQRPPRLRAAHAAVSRRRSRSLRIGGPLLGRLQRTHVRAPVPEGCAGSGAGGRTLRGPGCRILREPGHPPDRSARRVAAVLGLRAIVHPLADRSRRLCADAGVSKPGAPDHRRGTVGL
jgi:hypothetical protein